MTAKLINLRQARKRKNRAEDEIRAKENRALYGRPSHEKKLDKAEATRADRALEQHRLDQTLPPTEEDSDE